MEYEDLDSILDRRGVSREQPTSKLEYNEQKTAAASFDVQRLQNYDTQQDVEARESFASGSFPYAGFSRGDREVEASPRSDALSVVYASVDRTNRGGLKCGLSSSSPPTDQSDHFLYSKVDRNLCYDAQREGNRWQDDKTTALYSSVQPREGNVWQDDKTTALYSSVQPREGNVWQDDKTTALYSSVQPREGNVWKDDKTTELYSSVQPREGNVWQDDKTTALYAYAQQREGNIWQDDKTKALYSSVQQRLQPSGGYSSCGLYDVGYGDMTNDSYRYLNRGFGDVSCGPNVDRSGIYSFIRPDYTDTGFHSAVDDSSLGRYYSKNDQGIYELEQPVVSPRFGENIHVMNTGYGQLQELPTGNKCGGFGFRGQSLSSQDRNVYSFIRSDSVVGDEHLGPYAANGRAFLAGDVLQIAERDTPEDMSLTGALCSRCQQGFSRDEEIVNSSGQIWHTKCFVCAQCFQQFPDGIFYEFEGRKYCEHDFNVLFAPCCGQCKEFIIGRVIKAMNCNWHPDCFVCQLCSAPLADAGFIKNAGRALCRECNTKEKARGTGKYVCHKCHSIIEEGFIKYKGEVYHPYHFNCTTCSVELNADAREKGGELYCLRCHDKMGIPICGACRRPIEERVVYALGKSYHVEHFVCAKCEKPFLGTRHYEKKGLAYCETHYHQLFGNICFVCNCVVTGDVFTALNKAWCVDHFACSVCDRKMSQKTKFFEVDLKPVCKTCYEKFPAELKKRLKKAYDQQMKK